MSKKEQKPRKRPDLRIVGRKIAQLRREKGLCMYDFAFEAGQPAWMMMLMENLEAQSSMELASLIPDCVVEEMVREICRAFCVSRRWLTTDLQSPEHPPLPDDGAPKPHVMYLPIMITADDVMHCIDDLLRMAVTGAGSRFGIESMIRQEISSVTQLHQLLTAYEKQNGSEVWSAQERERVRGLLRSRLEALDAHDSVA